MNKMTRQEVYALINGERAYQDSLGADRKRDVGPTITLTQAEFFTLMHVYLAKAETAWTNNPGEYVEDAQAHVRKIAAMCVQSMEKYGAPPRK
jgi:hypothetical protein